MSWEDYGINGHILQNNPIKENHKLALIDALVERSSVTNVIIPSLEIAKYQNQSVLTKDFRDWYIYYLNIISSYYYNMDLDIGYYGLSSYNEDPEYGWSNNIPRYDWFNGIYNIINKMTLLLANSSSYNKITPKQYDYNNSYGTRTQFLRTAQYIGDPPSWDSGTYINYDSSEITNFLNLDIHNLEEYYTINLSSIFNAIGQFVHVYPLNMKTECSSYYTILQRLGFSFSLFKRIDLTYNFYAKPLHGSYLDDIYWLFPNPYWFTPVNINNGNGELIECLEVKNAVDNLVNSFLSYMNFSDSANYVCETPGNWTPEVTSLRKYFPDSWYYLLEPSFDFKTPEE